MTGKIGLILAHELAPDGSPSQYTKERIESAREYLPNEQVILSGGCLERYPKHSLSDAMQKYAIKLGFRPEQIIIEPLSNETVGQLIFTRWGILEPRGLTAVVIFTHDWHLPRAIAEAKQILGEKYRIEGHAVPSRVPLEHNLGSYSSFLRTFEGVNFEIEQQVRDTLLKKHPRYSTSSLNYSKLFKKLKQENMKR